MRIFVSIIAAGLLLGSPAKAQKISAGGMYEDCTSYQGSTEYNFCHGFMIGYLQGVHGLMVLDKSKVLCFRDYDYFNEYDLMSIFFLTMKSAPKDGKLWNEQTAQVLMEILQSQFPCSK